MKLDFANASISQYLKKIGFGILKQDEDNIEYIKDKFIIGILVDNYSYEISAYFFLEDISDRVSLQSTLEYFDIVECRGVYQLPSLAEISVGLDYMTKVMERVLCCLEEPYSKALSDITVWYETTRTKRLEEYYFNTDMEMAEKYWKEKEYEKAKELYVKNKLKLSENQLKKLEYIINKEEQSVK